MSVRSSLLGNIGIIVVLNLLTKPIWVVTENLVQNALGHTVWGGYGAILGFTLIVGALAELGVNQYCTKTLSHQPEKYERLFPYFWGIKLVTGLLYFTLLLGLGWALGYTQQIGLLLGIGFAQWIIGLVAFFRALMQARHDFKLDALAGVLDKTLLLLPVLFLLAVGISIHSFIAAVLGTSLFSLVLFGGWALRRYGWVRPRLSLPQLRSILGRSSHFALIFLLFMSLERLNLVLVERWAGEEANGLYQGAYRFFSMFQMYLWTVLPIFYAKFARNHLDAAPEQQRLFNTGQGVVAVPMLWIFLVLWHDNVFLFGLFKNSSPEQIGLMAETLRVMSLALLFNSVFNIYSTYLTASGRERYVNLLLILAILVDVVVLRSYVGELGPVAGAYGLVAAFAVLSVGFVYSLWRTTVLRPPLLLLLKLLLVLALGQGVFMLGNALDFSWVLVSLAAGLVMLGLSLALRVIELRLRT
ncbi:MAG: lipopolysaccharide biosynthesis protein [Bacteroidetes bacterium]|jgi:O-antigen/teichoic acid export membrane protein|nr:lipopolysaccharide biosynthesis protein [Bacteroidota bacterium]